jgi:ATP-dependent protease ClpP protease subunit
MIFSSINFIFVFVINLLFLLPLNAADFKINLDNEGNAIIFVNGDIEYGDDIKFKRMALMPDKGLVVFESRGGNLVAGLEIGRAIRLKGFDTIVLESGLCTSSCALAWLGGVNRYLGRTASVGFHAAFRPVGGQNYVASVGNARVGAYAKELGLSDRAIDYITIAQPDEMQWLNALDAKKVGINVDIRDLNNTPKQSYSPNIEKDYRQLSGEFVLGIFNIWSQDNYSTQNKLSSLYSDNINFYGSYRTRTSVIDEKIQFMNRWPIRNYVARSNSLNISCDNNKICTIQGVVDWNAKSIERNASSSGLASFEYVIDLSTNNPKIVSENGKVLSRR